MNEQRNRKLQDLCCEYLYKLRYMARKHGLENFVKDTIKKNRQGKCKGTEHECQMLARLVDDERVRRIDIPKILGKSYRQTVENNDFKRVKRLDDVGVYSKVSALLLKEERKKLTNENKEKR